MDRVYIPLNVAGSLLFNADVLSYRNGPMPKLPHLIPGWLAGKAIAICGRGDECHTGMLSREGGELVALGMRFGAQKLKLLVDEVDTYPGLIDVYRYVGCTTFSGPAKIEQHPDLKAATRQAVVNAMRRFALHDQYGALNVARSSLYFLPGLRWFSQPHSQAVDDMKRPPFCSQAVHMTYRLQAGVQLLKNRADRQVLPGDIVTSPMLAYVCTLVPATNFPSPVAWYYEAGALANCVPINKPTWGAIK